MQVRKKMIRFFKYCLNILIASILFGCNNKVESFETKQNEILELGSSSKFKLIEIEFPFSVSIKNNLDGWRCTANQPYCKTYHNDSLEVRFCHLYTNKSESFLLKSEIEKSNFLNHTFQEEIKSESKRFAGQYNSILLPIKIYETGENQILQSGYIINWKQKSLFKKYYNWSIDTEYLSMELNSIKEKPFKELDYFEEIKYIIDNLKGIPVHNKR
jgi:hypothetical protein